MRSLKLSLASISLIVGLSSTAAAQQATFEDAGTSYGYIAGPYVGLNWDNAFVLNPSVIVPTKPGGLGSVVSGNYAMLNGGGHTMSISGASFNLMGGNFAAAWTNGLNLSVKGYSAGNLLYDQNYSLNWSTAQYLNLNLFGVDNVTFSSSGGTLDKLFPEGSNQSFAADNFDFSTGEQSQFAFREAEVSVVPEPMTMTLMGAGLLVLGGVQARRRRATKNS